MIARYLGSMNLFGIASDVEHSLRKRRTELTAYGRRLWTVGIRRIIFQGD